MYWLRYLHVELQRSIWQSVCCSGFQRCHFVIPWIPVLSRSKTTALSPLFCIAVLDLRKYQALGRRKSVHVFQFTGNKQNRKKQTSSCDWRFTARILTQDRWFVFYSLHAALAAAFIVTFQPINLFFIFTLRLGDATVGLCTISRIKVDYDTLTVVSTPAMSNKAKKASPKTEGNTGADDDVDKEDVVRWRKSWRNKNHEDFFNLLALAGVTLFPTKISLTSVIPNMLGYFVDSNLHCISRGRNFF